MKNQRVAFKCNPLFLFKRLYESHLKAPPGGMGSLLTILRIACSETVSNESALYKQLVQWFKMFIGAAH